MLFLQNDSIAIIFVYIFATVEKLLSHISIKVNEKIYLKNPETSNLGKKIIEHSIHMIDEIGFEAFTFRKLGKAINSTEASVYRYFDNKRKLLLYLIAWYWCRLEYYLVFGLANIQSPADRLQKAISILTEKVNTNGNLSYINERKLYDIVVSESSKAYLTKEVDEENKQGFFTGYKQLVARVSDLILEVNPTYKYPHMLVSTVIEGAHHQRFFAKHLPKLTDVVKGKDCISSFFTTIVFKEING